MEVWTSLHYPRDDSGSTEYKKLTKIQEQGGQVEIPEVSVPYDVMHVWEYFLDLHGTRQSGFGAGPISYHEMLAWSALNSIRLTPWEVQMLRQMDICFLNVCNEIQDRQKKKPLTPTSLGGGMKPMRKK